MKILIVNDDGIKAPGIALLVEWAKKVGDVTVVAPKTEQSGKSQSIELKRPMEIKRVDVFEGIPCYSVDSTPADCVRFGLRNLDPDFELVLSGINRGFNLGTDIMYSGTCGAIFEAAKNGKRAIAVSTGSEGFDFAVGHLDDAYSFIVENGLFDFCRLFNVNFPVCRDEEYRGVRLTRQGLSYYTDRFVPIGNDLYEVRGCVRYGDPATDDYDTDAVRDGYISISPLTIDRTAVDAFEALKGRK